MIYRRATFLSTGAGVAAAVAGLRFPGDAAEFEYKMGVDQPVTHSITIRATEATEAIKRDSNGRISISVFPNNQLGDDQSMLNQVRAGALQFFPVSGGIIANIVPVAAMEGVAFAFTDYKQAYAAMDGPFGANIRAAIVKAGLYTFDKSFCAGFHHVVNSVRPIVVPADLKGVKLRVPPAPIEVAAFKGLDASPVPINMAETYTSLQTRVVDGAALPLATVSSYKLYEVQKYLSLTTHLYASQTLLANPDAMTKLPPALRTIVEHNYVTAMTKQRTDTVRLDSAMEGNLKVLGMAVNRPNLAPFRTVVQQSGYYTQYRDKFGADAWALLEKAIGSPLR